jgi:hypothetical protein
MAIDATLRIAIVLRALGDERRAYSRNTARTRSSVSGIGGAVICQD